MTQEFKPLTNENHAIELNNREDNVFINSPMFKLKDLISAIQRKFLEINHKDWEEEKQDRVKHRKKWLSEGMDCEILQLGSYQWKKGKLRINVTLEFAPDEPESPLDNVRQVTK